MNSLKANNLACLSLIDPHQNVQPPPATLILDSNNYQCYISIEPSEREADIHWKRYGEARQEIPDEVEWRLKKKEEEESHMTLCPCGLAASWDSPPLRRDPTLRNQSLVTRHKGKPLRAVASLHEETKCAFTHRRSSVFFCPPPAVLRRLQHVTRGCERLWLNRPLCTWESFR